MKLASVEAIQKVLPHPNADKLEIVLVLGYQCIVPKGVYNDLQRVIFIQPDTVLPTNEAWAEPYLKYVTKRVKAVRLRGEWSEGIIAPLSIFPTANMFVTGTDIANYIGVTKYEPPLPTTIGAKGGLPYSIPKTDEERWENMKGKIPFGDTIDVTLKVDGQSWTAYYNIEEDKFGVCGRTMEYDLNSSNNYVRNVDQFTIAYKLIKYCTEHKVSLALRGESYGASIQGLKLNPHSKHGLGLVIFSVYLIDERRYAEKGHQHYFVNVCKELNLPTVPLLQENVQLTQDLINYYSKETEKVNGEYFEGVVIKHSTGSFKVINKFYDSNK